MNNMKEIAQNLSKILEDIKTKPVVVKTVAKVEEALKGETLNENDVAVEIFKTVVDNAPTGIDPTSVGEALLIAATTKAEETNTSTRQVIESVFDYLIKVIETAQGSLEEQEKLISNTTETS